MATSSHSLNTEGIYPVKAEHARGKDAKFIRVKKELELTCS
jgi:hypothetical protein